MRGIEGNRITLLKNGGQYFPAMVAAIESASVDIRLETYIFEDDASGNLVAAALARAARRGVRVRVLVDGLGSRLTPPGFFEAMRAAGATVMVFRPEKKLFSFERSRLRRVHRKIALIDNRVGFVGGINIIDDLNKSLSDFPRYDYAVQVEGPLLAVIYPVVHTLWRWVAWQRLRKEDIGPRPPMVVPASAGSHHAEFVVRDNFRHRRSIERMYLKAIGEARERVLLMNPYFLPGRRLRRALVEAAGRGVRVTILLQGRADHPVLQMATRALFGNLLGAGIEIFEYEKSMLHGKIAAVDDRWATVGSSNLDPFSLFLNREANVVVYDGGFARELRESVEAEIAEGAVACRVEHWKQRPFLQRVGSWLAYGFARWVAGLIGFAKHWE
jgi:cardiolipin synthase